MFYKSMVILMKKEKMLKLLKQKSITIPIYIYKLYDKFNIDLPTFIFLMYLYNLDEKIIFNPQKISEDFCIPVGEVLAYVDKLTSNNLVSFEIIKNEKNISEEYLSLSYFYEKLSILLMEESNENYKEDLTSIFKLIEKEFGRVLSPIEYEIIKAWHEDNISDDLIKEALKEAVFNGVSNLRYIDKILFDWRKKGIKNKDDVENNRKAFRKKEEKMEVFEYDWLEDDE